MIVVMIRFQYENEFDEARLQQIVQGARKKFDEVARIYGVRPSIEYLALAALVENPPSEGRSQ